ncbi:MAG: ATP-binding protein, partial [bacterium]
MNKRKSIIFWVAILIIGLLVIWFAGFRIILEGKMERWQFQLQQIALRADADLKLRQEKLLVLQQVMKTYLEYESGNIILPKEDSTAREWRLYHGLNNDSLIILSPFPLNPDELRSCEFIIRGSYPFIKNLDSEFKTLIRIYLRLQSGPFIEYFYRDLPPDSVILDGFFNTPERKRKISGTIGQVEATRPFIGHISKKELITSYTALVYKDRIIGEICMDVETNSGFEWLKSTLPDVSMVMFDSTGTIYGSNEGRYIRNDTLMDIYNFLPDFRNLSFSSPEKTNELVTRQETPVHYIFVHVIRHFVTAIYMEKTAVKLSIFVQLVPFFLVFIALWLASWLYYQQRIITRKLKTVTADLKVAKIEAESANSAKSVFLANMSHEIRTPMNAIIGFSQILSATVRDPVQSNYIKSISSSGKTLLNLINDILDLSKIEAGKLEINPVPFNIRQLLAEIGSLFQVKAEEKGISLVIHAEDNLPENLIADELRLRQVLLNLMSNAIKFTEEGEIRLNSGSINNTDDRLDLVISVKDTGIGIKKDQQARIFGAFEQVENQDTRRYGGTGLGLAITSKLVTMMGGTIRIESEPFIGTT